MFNELLIPFSCFGNFKKDICDYWNNFANINIVGYSYNIGGYTISEAGHKILLFGIYFSYLLSGFIGILHKLIDNLFEQSKGHRMNGGIAFILSYSSYELSPIKIEVLIIFFILFFISYYGRKLNNI
jgi:ABC-type Fe3+-siderophore transport system permease subunit